VTAGDGCATDKAAEEKAKWTTDLYAAPRRYNNMQKGTLFPFVLETEGFMHARGRLLLRMCDFARLQAELADARRRVANYPSHAPLGVRTRRLIQRVSRS